MQTNTYWPSSKATVLLACSGGKDSTAAGLFLAENGIDFKPVFYDTGWEAQETYDYIRDVLPGAFGRPVETRQNLPTLAWDREVEAILFEATWLDGKTSAMVRWAIHKGMFPSPVSRRWCTQYMKMDVGKAVVNEVIAEGKVPTMVVGVRADESAARANLPEVELGDSIVWRPLLTWDIADIVAIHKRHGVPLNPLYATRGVGRVGCWPCIGSGKAEIRAIAELDSKRIDVIRALEEVINRYAQDNGNPPAFFQHATRNAEGKRPCTPIDTMVQWSRTKRGGKELDPRPLEPFTACTSLGLCDLPNEG